MARCNAEFMRVSLARELTKLRNELVSELNAQVAALPFMKTSKVLEVRPEKPVQPFICSAVPSAVDLTLNAERRTKIDIFGFDLRSQPITVSLMMAGYFIAPKKVDINVFRTQMKQFVIRPGEVNIKTSEFTIEQPIKRVRKDISNALSIISDFHAVLDLTESGFDLLPNSLEIVLSWDNKVQSEIAILTHQNLLQCEVISHRINESGTMKQTFIPPPVTENIYGKKPDKDFDGNGPCVNFNMSFVMDPERKTLTANYYMDAWECKGDFSKIHEDYTEARGSGSLVLFQAEDNEKIIGFDVDSYMEDSYFDTNHQQDIKYFGGTKPVTQLTYVGDTDGDEAGSKTGVTMVFRPINIKVERCELK
jgi:hypothetical protein